MDLRVQFPWPSSAVWGVLTALACLCLTAFLSLGFGYLDDELPPPVTLIVLPLLAVFTGAFSIAASVITADFSHRD